MLAIGFVTRTLMFLKISRCTRNYATFPRGRGCSGWLSIILKRDYENEHVVGLIYLASHQGRRAEIVPGAGATSPKLPEYVLSGNLAEVAPAGFSEGSLHGQVLVKFVLIRQEDCLGPFGL